MQHKFSQEQRQPGKRKGWGLCSGQYLCKGVAVGSGHKSVHSVWESGKAVSAAALGRAAAVGDGRAAAAGRSRSAPARPRRSLGAQSGQRQRRPLVEGPLWPSSSLADLLYRPSPPGSFLPPRPPPLVHSAPPPAASPSRCPGASPRWCGMGGKKRRTPAGPPRLGACHPGSPPSTANRVTQRRRYLGRAGSPPWFRFRCCSTASSRSSDCCAPALPSFGLQNPGRFPRRRCQWGWDPRHLNKILGSGGGQRRRRRGRRDAARVPPRN